MNKLGILVVVGAFGYLGYILWRRMQNPAAAPSLQYPTPAPIVPLAVPQPQIAINPPPSSVDWESDFNLNFNPENIVVCSF